MRVMALCFISSNPGPSPHHLSPGLLKALFDFPLPPVSYPPIKSHSVARLISLTCKPNPPVPSPLLRMEISASTAPS